ncbi:hypothetical protein [Sphingobacterium daejeonense]|uniref:hypothetical protein n=1 Tax=Sphingobacterium daejeonense TaxID=371142 RepID=UPI0010C4A9AC|nr:hypothetical protein [Sphingobacterium daejeonense]VTQ05718.1 Uncharacterised protein [Sphingobacterium daejeonense]
MNIFKSIPLFIIIFVSCQSGAKNKETVNFPDSAAMCYTSAIPSRFSAIQKDSLEKNMIGEDKSEMVMIEGGTFEMEATVFKMLNPYIKLP